MNKLPMVIDHATGLPVSRDTTAITQLGTADWYRGGGRAVRHFKVGDFFLGRTEKGELVGLNDDRHVHIRVAAARAAAKVFPLSSPIFACGRDRSS